MKKLGLVFFVFILASCATIYEPIPAGYTGETATVKDSYTNLASTKAHYFILYKMDDQYVSHSWSATRSANYGMGMLFTPSMVTRKVTTEEHKYTIQGLVFFPTDVQALIGDNMSVEKEFLFSPAAGETYTVKGELSKEGSKVWLEDSSGSVIEGSYGEGN